VIDFRISSARTGTGGWIISLFGEVDLYTAPQLERELERAAADGCREVIVDLAGASFIDSTVLGVVLAAVRRLEAEGGSLVLVTDDRRILRVFELAGVAHRFRFEPSLPQALDVLAVGEHA
jgi:anti-sigma B factor antagonist